MTDPKDMPTSELLEVYIESVMYLAGMGNHGGDRRRVCDFQVDCAAEIDRRIPKKEKSDGS